MVTSDEIVHNGPRRKTSAASFPAPDSDFVPARPGLTFEVLAFIRRGKPREERSPLQFSIYFNALTLN